MVSRPKEYPVPHSPRDAREVIVAALDLQDERFPITEMKLIPHKRDDIAAAFELRLFDFGDEEHFVVTIARKAK